MKSIGIMADSHCSITTEEAKKLGIHVLAMPFFVDGKSFLEDVTISRAEFYEKLRIGADVATSQHSPEVVMQMWDELLEEYEKVLYLPISSGLSGSCMTAQAMAQDEKYAGRILVVDNGRVSVLQLCSILDALEMIKKGYSAEEIKDKLEENRENMSIYISLSTLEYLKKGGRIKPAVATIANVLNIKPVLQLGTEKLDVFQKCRGMQKAKKVMIEAVRNDLQTKLKDWYDAGKVYLLAASSASEEAAAEWVEQIKAEFPGMEVMYGDLSLGVSCHVGADGLGIGCSCKL